MRVYKEFYDTILSKSGLYVYQEGFCLTLVLNGAQHSEWFTCYERNGDHEEGSVFGFFGGQPISPETYSAVSSPFCERKTPRLEDHPAAKGLWTSLRCCSRKKGSR